MTVIASTLYVLTKLLLMVASSDVVNGECQPASRDYQMHQGNILAFYPSPVQDHVLKDTIYQVRNASSDVVCAVHCLQDDYCRSFNYCTDKLCHLKTANYSGKGLEIKLSAGCRHYGDEELQTEGKLSEGSSLCAQNTHRFRRTMELQLPMTSPVRIEFTVNMGQWLEVLFSPDASGIGEAFCEVGLSPGFAAINIRNSSTERLTRVHVKTSVNYTFIGVPVLITYDNGRFEVAFQGLQDFNLTYDVTSPPQSSWFVGFDTDYSPGAELSFTEPCINDFNPFDPQFIPQIG